MKVRVTDIFKKDEFTYKQGPLAGKDAYGWLLEVETLDGSTLPADGLKLNTMVPNEIHEGDEFEALLTVGENWGTRDPDTGEDIEFAPCKMGQGSMKRARGGSNGARPQNRPATAQGAPQSHAAPPQAPRVVPTVTESGATLIGLYDRMLSAVKAVHAKANVDSDPARVAQAMATTLYIDLRSERIRADPTQAQLAAEAEAQAAAVKAEEERLERELEAAREKLRQAAPKPPVEQVGYTGSTGTELGSDDIPF
jgi:hypothetical protein